MNLPHVFLRTALLLPLLYLPAAHSAKNGVFEFVGKGRMETGPVDIYATTFSSGKSCEVLLGKSRENAPINNQALSQLLSGGGYVVKHPQSNRADVNCHGFSCEALNIPHLPKNVWIKPESLIPLLGEYFKDVGLAYNWENSGKFLKDPKLRQNDLVVMALGRMIQHSGLVIKKGNENWILSKLDEDMVVVASMENLMDHYGINYVRVFRKK